MTYVLLFLSLLSINAHAWGRRGHQIVGETAARLVDPGSTGIATHGFDLGYYANAPDLIWKRPATFELERVQHFMDLEVFEAAFKAKPEVKTPFALSRAEFDKTFPEVPPTAGRAYWRVRELFARLLSLSERIKAPELARNPRRDLQLRWLVTAGVLGHYIGDLGQPQHTTGTRHGGEGGQTGLHYFFETDCVDHFYPAIDAEVFDRARREWPAFTKKNRDLEVLALTQKLAAESSAKLDLVIEIDRKFKHDDRAKTCAKYRPLLVQRLSASAMTLAELLRRGQGFTFDNDRFYFYAGEPPYIPPGESADD